MTAFPSPGERFQDRYVIDSLIGAGGFARVYRARQVDLDRAVAIKVLDPNVGSNRDNQAELLEKLATVSKRFEQEAKLVSRLRDPHTVAVHDYGRTESGLLYMVLEYVDGKTLFQLIRESGAIAPERVVKILRQCLLSLQEAHALGVLHRDIKPANIMVYEHIGRADQIKVLDFGIAKLVGSETNKSSEMTAEDVLVGTPRYMSPEQIRGETELTASADIYSLGLVIYELLTGTRAIDVESSMGIIARHLDPDPLLIPSNSPIPWALRQIVDRMLMKSQRRRYQYADEILRDLEHWNLEYLPGTEPVVEELPPPSSSKALLIAGIIALLSVSAAMIVYGVTRSQPSVEVAEPTRETPDIAPPATTAKEVVPVEVAEPAKVEEPPADEPVVAEPEVTPSVEPTKTVKRLKKTKPADVSKPEPESEFKLVPLDGK